MKKVEAMKLNLSRSLFLVPLALLVSASGCGNSYEPLAVLYPSSGATVTLSSPGGTVSGTFSSSTPYFTFNTTTLALAPAAGFVTDVALEAGGTYMVSMYHSQRLQTQIGNLTASSVRKGDYLAAGGAVGTPSLNTFRLTAYRDGAVSCPYFDMTAAVRAALVITGASCAN